MTRRLPTHPQSPSMTDPEPSDSKVKHPPSPEFMATVAAPLHEGPGTRIGPYKILQLIGEGGFGSVFMAQQEQPVARRGRAEDH